MSLVTVVVGQVGDGYTPIAHYCKGTVYIISHDNLEDNSVTALKRDDLNLNFVKINFFNVLSSYQTIKHLKNDILQKYGGIDVLINNCTYNFQANTTLDVELHASILVNFNCLTVMKVCEVLISLLKKISSTVIYCALKYDYFCAIPNNNIKKTIQDNSLTSHQLKKWLNQYLEASKVNNHEAAWGNTPYAVSKAGFVALKNIHKRKLISKGIKLFHDYGIEISVAPFCDSMLLLLQELKDLKFPQDVSQVKQSPSKDQSELSRLSTAHKVSTINEESTINKESTVDEENTINEESTINKESTVDEENTINEESIINKESTVDEENTVNEESIINEECTIHEKSTIDEESIINEASTINEISTINKENKDTELSISEVNTIQKKRKKRVLQNHIDNYNNIKRGKIENNTAISIIAKNSQYLNVAVANPQADLTEEEAIYIQKELQKALLAMCNQKSIFKETCIPSFNKNPMYNEGVVKFWCLNDKSLAWLTETIAKLKVSNEYQLHVIDQRDIPGRVQAALFIPDFDGSVKDLQALLYHQNPWYNINLWSLSSCEKTKTEKPSGTFLILNIPKEDAFKIVECKQRIHYAMGIIKIKFINNSGFSNKPLMKRKSIGNNENNWQLIPIASEQNNISDTSISQFPSLGDAIKEINGFLDNNLEFSWEDC